MRIGCSRCGALVELDRINRLCRDCIWEHDRLSGEEPIDLESEEAKELQQQI